MNKNLKIIVVLIIITCVGGFLRFYKNTENPPSLNGDEISFGYSAYSILKTGRDEHGQFMPLTFRSVGDYKNPLPVYLMVLSIKLFGFNEFSVRFFNAFFGTLMIPAFYLFLNKIFNDRKISLVGTLFLTLSPWHIFYSRYGYETLIASFFVMLGIWFYIKLMEGSRFWAVPSAFFLILTMYTAFAPRLFIPIFAFVVFIFSFNKFKARWDKLLIFILTSVILVLPLVYVSLFQAATTRLAMVFIYNDIDFIRYGIFHYFQSINDTPLLLFFWLRRYLNYLQPDFLFFNGLNMTAQGTFGLGLFYLFEIPFLIMGTIQFIKRKISYKWLLVIWLFTGIIPDSLTNNQQSAGRLLQIIPVMMIITSLGAIHFIKWFISIPNKYVKFFLLGISAIVILLIVLHIFLTFVVHFPGAKGESFDEGFKEAVLYVREHQDGYQEIVFDPRRGIEGPYMVSNPYLYVLFYTQYDPHTYQIEPKILSRDKTYSYRFNKYTFRDIDWTEDKKKKNTLFIGSPWSFPEKKLKEGELLGKIYMKSGDPAFFIVSPKQEIP